MKVEASSFCWTFVIFLVRSLFSSIAIHYETKSCRNSYQFGSKCHQNSFMCHRNLAAHGLILMTPGFMGKAVETWPHLQRGSLVFHWWKPVWWTSHHFVAVTMEPLGTGIPQPAWTNPSSSSLLGPYCPSPVQLQPESAVKEGQN